VHQGRDMEFRHTLNDDSSSSGLSPTGAVRPPLPISSHSHRLLKPRFMSQLGLVAGWACACLSRRRRLEASEAHEITAGDRWRSVGLERRTLQREVAVFPDAASHAMFCAAAYSATLEALSSCSSCSRARAGAESKAPDRSGNMKHLGRAASGQGWNAGCHAESHGVHRPGRCTLLDVGCAGQRRTLGLISCLLVRRRRGVVPRRPVPQFQ
jgi:hypothetical protein